MPEEDQSSSRKAFILELLSGLGKIEGRTKFQNSILGQMELGLLSFSNSTNIIRPIPGPYETIEDLIATGYIKEEKSTGISSHMSISFRICKSEIEIPFEYIFEDKIEILKNFLNSQECNN